MEEDKPTFNYYKSGRKAIEFTCVELDSFINTFKGLDVEQVGSIPTSQFAQFLSAVGTDASDGEVAELTEELAEDGSISWDKTLEALKALHPEKSAELRKEFWYPSTKFPEFTKDEIRVFIENFREFDADGSGTIDIKELKVAFEAMGQGCTEEVLKRVIGMVNDDGSSVITWPGFLQIMRLFYPEKRFVFEWLFYEPARKFPEFTRSEIDVFVHSFREIDTDGSGDIDASELKVAFANMGQGASDEEIKEIIDQVGEVGTGRINWKGFLKMMRLFYPWKRIYFEREFFIPAAKFPEFTRREIEVFVEGFKEFDADDSGAIDINELGVAFAMMGMGASKEALQKVIDEVDDDKSGEIEWPEFLKIMRMFYPTKRAEFEAEFYGAAKEFPEFSQESIDVFIEGFREFDVDGSGTIDAEELENAFRQMGQGVTKQRVLELIAEFDADKTGEIKWKGFLGIMRKLYAGTLKEEKKPAVSQPATKTTSQPAAKTATPATKTTAEPAKTTSQPAAKPAPATTSTGFQPAKTTSTATPAKATTPIGSSRGGNPTCAVCTKTVYPIEAVNAVELTFHKACFKCQEDGCGLTLTLKTFKGFQGKVFCVKHMPQSKPTAVTDSIAMKSAASAPKVSKVIGIKKDQRKTLAPGQAIPEGEEEE